MWGGVGEQAYNWWEMGEKATFRERKRFRVICTECRVTVTQLYLKQHMDILFVTPGMICQVKQRKVN